MRKRNRNHVWVLVKVWRGIPSGLRSFRTRQEAEAARETLVSRQDSQYDECEVFRMSLPPD